MNDNIRTFVMRCIQALSENVACEVEVVVPADIADEVGIVPGRFNRSPKTAGRRLSLFVGYCAATEVLEAFKVSAALGQDVAEFAKHFAVTRPVDLLIRTGGYQVISGFLPLLTGYARLYFVPELFNDLEPQTLRGIVSEFLRIPRRYGA